jgi:hypothetical protein
VWSVAGWSPMTSRLGQPTLGPWGRRTSELQMTGPIISGSQSDMATAIAPLGERARRPRGTPSRQAAGSAACGLLAATVPSLRGRRQYSIHRGLARCPAAPALLGRTGTGSPCQKTHCGCGCACPCATARARWLRYASRPIQAVRCGSSVDRAAARAIRSPAGR